MKRISMLFLYLCLAQTVAFSQRAIQIIDSGSDLIIKEGVYSRSFPKKEISTTLTGTTKLDILYGLQPILKLISNTEVTNPTSTSLTDLQTKIITMIGALPTITETDPTVPTAVKGITAGQISNWNTSYSWGNHASGGYAKLANTETFTGAKTFSVAPTFSAGINVNGTAFTNSIFPNVTGASDVGRATGYYANGYLSALYLNSTAYFSGGTAGQIISTGNIVPSSNGTNNVGAGATAFLNGYFSNNLIVPIVRAAGPSGLGLNNSGNTTVAKVFDGGQFAIQNGGTYTNSGEQFQLLGTSKFDGASDYTVGINLRSAAVLMNYNTTDQVTNFERAYQRWTGNTYQIGTESGGTGTSNRPMTITAGTSLGMTGNNASLVVGTANASGIFNFTRALSTGNITLIGLNGSQVHTTGVNSGMAVINTLGMTGTGSFNAFYASPFLSGNTTSATNYLLNLGTNSAAGNGGTHTPVYTVDLAGNTAASGVVSSTAAPGTYGQFVAGSTGNPGKITVNNGVNGLGGLYMAITSGNQPRIESSGANGLQVVATNSTAQVKIGAEGASGTVSIHAGNAEAIGISSARIITFSNVPTYADNAAATTAGLAVGTVYRTSTGQLMIRY